MLLVVAGMLFAETALSRFAKETVKEVTPQVTFHASNLKSFDVRRDASRDSAAVEEEKED